MAKILVVDDEDSVRIMVKEILEPSGYDIIEASNGEEAYQQVKDSDVDLLITDIVMPEKSGIDLIMQLHDEYPKMPILAISGGGGIQGRFDYLPIAKLIGALCILKKPFSVNQLRESVANILS